MIEEIEISISTYVLINRHKIYWYISTTERDFYNINLDIIACYINSIQFLGRKMVFVDLQNYQNLIESVGKDNGRLDASA